MLEEELSDVVGCRDGSDREDDGSAGVGNIRALGRLEDGVDGGVLDGE